MFHNGSSFHAALYSVHLIVFLLVLRLWRSQWAFFGRVTELQTVLLLRALLLSCHWERQLLRECVSHPYSGTGIAASVSWSWWFNVNNHWSLGERDIVQNKNQLKDIILVFITCLRQKGCVLWIILPLMNHLWITLMALTFCGLIVFSYRFDLSTNSNVRLCLGFFQLM